MSVEHLNLILKKINNRRQRLKRDSVGSGGYWAEIKQAELMNRPDCDYKVQEKIKQRNLSGDSAAAGNPRSQKAAKSNGKKVNKTLKTLTITLLPLLLIVLFVAFIYHNLSRGFLFGKYELEQFDLTYQQYQKSTYADEVMIPESSANIAIFRFALRDCGYGAIQARVKEGVPDLYTIVSSYKLYDVARPTLAENVPSQCKR